MLALLRERNQRVLYIPGLTVDRARDAYRGESKTDARDAHLIADQARMRPGLAKLKPGEKEIVELQLLLARRRDLVTDQSRIVTRLREALLSLFPALERALDLNGKGPFTLLAHYQTPAQLRRAGHKRVAAYLRNRGVKGSANVAHKALSAARSQSATLPAQDVASRIVAELAEEILAFKERIARIDEELGQRFFARPEARILASLPGMGPILGAEFLVCVGDICAFESADRLAASTPDWCPHPMTPASGWVTAAGCAEATRTSKGSSTSRRLPACVVHRSPGPSTIARGRKVRGTLKLSSR